MPALRYRQLRDHPPTTTPRTPNEFNLGFRAKETVKSFGGLAAAASNRDSGRVDVNFTAPEMDPTEDKEALNISEDLSSDVESMPQENLDMCHVCLDEAFEVSLRK